MKIFLLPLKKFGTFLEIVILSNIDGGREVLGGENKKRATSYQGGFVIIKSRITYKNNYGVSLFLFIVV